MNQNFGLIGKKLGNESDRLTGLYRQAEDIRPVILDAFWNITQRWRDGIDAPCVEPRPDDARAHRAVAVGDEPSFQRLVRRIAQREHKPTGTGAGGQGPDRHRPGRAVRTGSGLDTQVVAAALVAFPEAGNIDALELGIDLDGLERMG